MRKLMKKPIRRQTFVAITLAASSLFHTAWAKTEIPATFTHIETVKKHSDDDYIIPYQKYRLKNGLTVILHEDHSDPIARIELTYHVGSAHEPEHRKGLAHFFEHMMFEGSEHITDGEIDTLIKSTGGSNNAYTNKDITKYHTTVPSNHLERVLWIESDRMGFFLAGLDDELVEGQRKVIRNERLQNVDQKPYRLANELLNEAFYPEGHPYQTPVLGYHHDIDNISTAELRQFFLTFYSPNNATLVIGGDIDVAQTLRWIDKYFGAIPKGPEVKKPTAEVVKLKENRYLSSYGDVKTPTIVYSYHVPQDKNVNDALDYLDAILSSGKESWFYKKLHKENITSYDGASADCLHLSCNFSLSFEPKTEKGVNLKDVVRAVDDVFAEFEKTGVSDEEIAKFKDQLRASQVYGWQSVNGKVDALSYYENKYGDPKRIRDDYKNILAVSKDDVMNAYNTYIKGQPKLVFTLLPKEDKAKKPLTPDNWTRPEHKVQKAVAAMTELKPRKTPQTFDRSVKPVSPPTPALTFPEVWEGKLKNGIKVYGISLTETPMTAFSLKMRAGSWNDPKYSVAPMTRSMMKQATTEHSDDELSIMLKRLGSSVSFSSGKRTTSLSVTSISDNLDKTLAIAEERLFKPAFLERDFNRIQSNWIQSTKEDETNEKVIANNVFYEILYPEDNNTIAEDIAGLKELTLDDVKQFYRSAYSANGAVINVVSNLDKATLMKKLAVFDTLPPKPFVDYALTPSASLKKHLYFVDKPDAKQSVVILGKHALKWDATGEYFKNRLMNYPLGQSFDSRINKTLREEKGYTYGASAYFSGNTFEGRFRARIMTKTANTADAIKDLVGIIDDYRENGITDEELKLLKQSYGQGDVMDYETPSEKLSYLFDIGFDKLPKDYNQQQHDILASITKAEINAQAKKWLGLDDAIIVVVGKKAEIGDDLIALAKSLDMPFTELDFNAQPVKTQSE